MVAFQPLNRLSAACVSASSDDSGASRAVSLRAGIDTMSFCRRIESSIDTLSSLDSTSSMRTWREPLVHSKPSLRSRYG